MASLRPQKFFRLMGIGKYMVREDLMDTARVVLLPLILRSEMPPVRPTGMGMTGLTGTDAYSRNMVN